MWIRLQVSHWLGVGTISRAFGSPEAAAFAVPSICLIAVRHPNGPREVEPWKDTVRDLYRDNSTQTCKAEEAVDVITSIADQPETLYSAEEVVDVIISIADQPETPGQHHVFKKWNEIVKGKKTTAKPAIHCEAALTSLAKYSCDLQFGYNLRLTGLLQVMFSLCDQCARQSDAFHRTLTKA
jgi:hypothetical protein